MSFAKIDSAIINSSIYADSEALQVFIGLVVQARPQVFEQPVPAVSLHDTSPAGWELPPGCYGVAHVSIPGIARWTQRSIENVKAILERLSAPDENSTTPILAGRRIARIDGGFAVINFDKYRTRDHTASERMQRYREKKRVERQQLTKDRNDRNVTRNTVTDRNATPSRYTPLPSEAEADNSPLPPFSAEAEAGKEGFKAGSQAGAHTSAPSPAATPNGFKAPTGPELYALNRSIDDLTAQLAKLPEKTNPSRAMIGGVLTLVPHPLAAKRTKIQAELDALLAKRSQILAPPTESPTSKPVAP